MSELPVRPYDRRPATFEPWDPRTADVARELARLLDSARPGTAVHHIGSSSVPGLAGKGYVDLGVEAAPDEIPLIVEAAISLGFQRQTGPGSFPPARPLLLGTVPHEGTRYNVHLHVMPAGRAELAEQLGFRDALRADPSLRDAYAAEKRRIVADADAGSDAAPKPDYTFQKAEFVEETLYRLGLRRPPEDVGEPLAPGATIGFLGGGQLGRMMAFAARAMGYRVVALDPDPACPMAAVADEIVVGRYDDVEAARRLGARSDVVTYELEHVGLDAARAAAEGAPLRPGLAALAATQDRLAERRFLRDIGEQTAPWREVRGVAEARTAAHELGLPMRLKLPVGGYDGRSQVRVTDEAGIEAAVGALGGLDGRPLLAEGEVDFEAEVSVVVARGRDGRTIAYPISRNVHDEGVLAESVAPAPFKDRDSAAAERITYAARDVGDWVARRLDLVGVMTVELFLDRTGLLIVNELAPRVHNSGHWTIEGAATSQFEQHLRAILGLPLGSVAPHGAAAMVNLLGTGPDRPARLAGVETALADPGVHLHVYGKRRVFERRKMGHLTVVDDDAEAALERAWRAHAALSWED
ncbi:MAG TPA: 5-(carboxyamino)imidazole ribonucleotide synthase [Candidatus Limnocylindrales bacterium]